MSETSGKFPTIVYRVPGPYKAPGGNGKTYDYRGAQDQEEFDKLIEAGWFETIRAAEQAKSDSVDAESDNPTRAEMEQKAIELGIKFDGRTTDQKLLVRINQVLEGQ